MLLEMLLAADNNAISKVICLLRFDPATESAQEAAERRLLQPLLDMAVAGDDSSTTDKDEAERMQERLNAQFHEVVEVMCGDLALPRLGVADEEYEDLRR